jgi:hypothetical protein
MTIKVFITQSLAKKLSNYFKNICYSQVKMFEFILHYKQIEQCAITFRITTFSVTALNIMGLFVTLGILASFVTLSITDT